MQNQIYVVIDVETTGGGISGNRITEICIVRLCGNEIIEKYTSLVNPEKYIPPGITALTGIDNEMVEDAPKFCEIAKIVEDLTREAIFVAHNVNFDYNVIRNEFRNLGFEFIRKKLCTVRLSRKLIPGLLSYSLGRLCDSINIPHSDRHRAEGDTDATVILFQRLLSLDDDFTIIKSFLHAHSKQATLPPHISANQIHDLPEKPGVYLFKDQKHKIIYAGKAINIKKRVLSHFYDKKTSEYHLGQETYFVDHIETGNELLALLVESEHIRHHYPKFNRAQKRPGITYQIINYINKRGIIQLAIGKTKVIRDSIGTFYDRQMATEKLEKLCEEFNLCPRFCTLQSNVEVCSHYRIKNCEGICDGSEKVENYNEKVVNAIQSLEADKSTYIIREPGRHFEEEGFVLIKEGRFHGYGYLDQEISISGVDDLEDHIILQQSTYHTNQILRSYLKKHGEKNVVYFKNELVSESSE